MNNTNSNNIINLKLYKLNINLVLSFTLRIQTNICNIPKEVFFTNLSKIMCLRIQVNREVTRHLSSRYVKYIVILLEKHSARSKNAGYERIIM